MEVRYKRDLNSNYMILRSETAAAEDYTKRMFTENRIYGFLPCVVQRQGEAEEYYYEITGRQSMSLLYERRKLNLSQLRELLRELERILEAAGEYLLSPDHLLLKPDSVYLHTKTEKPALCYYPGYEKDIREAFLELAEYLLGKLDKNDAAGVEFGYGLYQKALEPNFSLAELLNSDLEREKERNRERLQPLKEEPAPVSVPEETLEKTGSWKNFFRRKKKKPQLLDYAEESVQMGSGAALFLREERAPETPLETAFLEKKREGLFLKCCSGEYPDFEIQEESFLIGKRKDTADGCLPAPTISRLHSRITRSGDQYYLEDLNSTNGTWADGVQLNPYEPLPLKDGMLIAFAGLEYEVQL